MQRSSKDFRVDTFRCGGHGGQNMQKNDTGVRVTDLITDLSSESRQERSQLQNKKIAFTNLIDKMLAFYEAEELELKKKEFHKPEQLVRIYKGKESFVKDVRLDMEFPLKDILDGRLTKLHDKLQEEENLK